MAMPIGMISVDEIVVVECKRLTKEDGRFLRNTVASVFAEKIEQTKRGFGKLRSFIFVEVGDESHCLDSLRVL
jgi:hypothetical protein